MNVGIMTVGILIVTPLSSANKKRNKGRPSSVVVVVQFSRGTDDEVASVEKLKKRTWAPEISPDYLDPSSDPPLSGPPSQMEVLVQN